MGTAVYIDGMETQNQIKRVLSEPSTIDRVGQMLAANPELNRTRLADLLCEYFDFVDGGDDNGQCNSPQSDGCDTAWARTLVAPSRSPAHLRPVPPLPWSLNLCNR